MQRPITRISVGPDLWNHMMSLCNNLVLAGNKLLPEPMLTKISEAILYQWDNNELIFFAQIYLLVTEVEIVNTMVLLLE